MPLKKFDATLGVLDAPGDLEPLGCPISTPDAVSDMRPHESSVHGEAVACTQFKPAMQAQLRAMIDGARVSDCTSPGLTPVTFDGSPLH